MVVCPTRFAAVGSAAERVLMERLRYPATCFMTTSDTALLALSIALPFGVVIL
jgi:hypothetical protein